MQAIVAAKKMKMTQTESDLIKILSPGHSSKT